MLIKIENQLKEKGEYRIGFVGDSLTSCEWVHPNWREIVEYVVKEEMQKKFSDWRIVSWGIRCFNFGFDGATTVEIAIKVNEMIEQKIDLVLGLMGGNDPVLGVDFGKTEESLRNMFNEFKRNGVDYRWATSLPDLRGKKNEIYLPYRNVTMKFENVLDIFEWYKQWDLNRFFTFISEENIDEGIKKGEPDPMHPNQLGNAYVAKFFLEKVFEISFDPEKYVATTLNGEKCPRY